MHHCLPLSMQLKAFLIFYLCQIWLVQSERPSEIYFILNMLNDNTIAELVLVLPEVIHWSVFAQKGTLTENLL